MSWCIVFLMKNLLHKGSIPKNVKQKNLFFIYMLPKTGNFIFKQPSNIIVKVLKSQGFIRMKLQTLNSDSEWNFLQPSIS